jgi:molecular chaperone DnaJ
MNLYVVLGVRREATSGEIRRAYRRLARRYHPDINPGDRMAADLFRRVSVAFETLSDPERRRRYDAEGDAPPDDGGSTFEFQGFDFSLRIGESHPPTFGELFADALGERAGLPPSQASALGADLHASVTLSFEESVRGTTRELIVTRLERCAPCTGQGRLAGPPASCAHCDGVGSVRVARGHMVFARTCPSCGGAGVVRFRVCGACGGEGVGVHTGPVVVAVPSGLDEGAEVIIPGEGHAGRRGGAAGALHLRVSVRPHPWFRRAGDDVHVEVPIAVHEAGLGARIEVPTIDGPMRMRVPPGTQSGQTFRFRGRGVPRAGEPGGDLLVSVRIVLPAVIDERSRELLREFAERNPENVRESLGVGGEGAAAAQPSAPRSAPAPRSDAAALET